MRKIEEKVIGAFVRGEKCEIGNTLSTGDCLYLYGHQIAQCDENGDYFFTLAGWNTLTTRSRLNAMLYLIGSSRHITNKNYEPYFGGELISPYSWYSVE